MQKTEKSDEKSHFYCIFLTFGVQNRKKLCYEMTQHAIVNEYGKNARSFSLAILFRQYTIFVKNERKNSCTNQMLISKWCFPHFFILLSNYFS